MAGAVAAREVHGGCAVPAITAAYACGLFQTPRRVSDGRWLAMGWGGILGSTNPGRLVSGGMQAAVRERLHRLLHFPHRSLPQRLAWDALHGARERSEKLLHDALLYPRQIPRHGCPRGSLRGAWLASSDIARAAIPVVCVLDGSPCGMHRRRSPSTIVPCSGGRMQASLRRSSSPSSAHRDQSPLVHGGRDGHRASLGRGVDAAPRCNSGANARSAAIRIRIPV